MQPAPVDSGGITPSQRARDGLQLAQGIGLPFSYRTVALFAEVLGDAYSLTIATEMARLNVAWSDALAAGDVGPVARILADSQLLLEVAYPAMAKAS